MRRFLIPSTVLGLALLSLITLSSIAPGLAPRQLIFFLIGTGVFFIISRVSFVRISRSSWLWYLGLCLLLVLTLVIGEDTRGTSRWIQVGDLFVIQASQLAVPIVALLVSHWLTRAKKIKSFDGIQIPQLNSLWEFIQIILIVMTPAILILVEPDLGTTVAYLLSVVAIFLFVKVKKIFVISALVAVVLSSIIGWNFVFKDYQKQRIASFISKQDFQGADYNSSQALIAVGSGKIFGRGLGQGIQSHLKFLPERQTDFIFASFSEEFGFLGTLVLISLYILMITAILRIGFGAENQAQFLFCVCVANMIGVQAAINIGMNIGLLPITGITLPLFSSGGSSVVSILATLGIVQGLHAQQKKQPYLSIN